MSRNRLAVPIVIVLLLLLAGAAWALLGPIRLPLFTDAPSAAKQQKSGAAKATASVPGGSPRDEAQPTFDISRVDPDGTSVFAGRAEPLAKVTILENGRAIGTAQADENGEWSLATEHKFASADPEIGLTAQPASASQAARDRLAALASAQGDGSKAAALPGSPSQEAKPAQHSAKSATSRMLKDLEGMVESARAVAQKKAVETKNQDPVRAEEAAAASANIKVAAVPSPPQPPPPGRELPKQKTIPVPITFEFNQSTFTGDGTKAASLLLEYLKLKQFSKVSFTGHADERGSDPSNMNLSQDRLDAVARYLKKRGFKGELELVPKGETEPFTGVDRRQYPLEELYQLDRRVELVITP